MCSIDFEILSQIKTFMGGSVGDLNGIFNASAIENTVEISN